MTVRLSIAFLTLLSWDLFGQEFQLKDKGSSILDSVYTSYIVRDKIPGLAVGVMLRDTVVYSKSFGVKNLKTKDLVTVESIFHLASVSKPFVATAVMQLVANNKISLDSPLAKYLPYFKLNSEEYQTITIRQMLAHTSGLPDVKDYEWHKPQYDDRAAERYVRSLKNLYLAFEPGDDFGYSNMAYDILGEVIAKVAGVTFEEYMSTNIFIPAKMFHSTFLKMTVKTDLATTPHVRGHLGTEIAPVYPYNRFHAPSSTLHSCVSDMLQWAAILSDSAKQDNGILSRSSFQQMTTSHFELDPFTSVGLGWFIHEDNETEYIFHMGGDVGFSSMITFFPKHQLSIVVLSNCDFTDVMHATSTAFRVLQQKHPLPNSDNLLFVR
jgi:CubicO group peptidase (beta-lactamase class C family)